ncbi:MAG: thioredoxin family protein [Bacteroidetes bacterium]|nr:thioredoxin family protein [Bacteroidota bacterium]
MKAAFYIFLLFSLCAAPFTGRSQPPPSQPRPSPSASKQWENLLSTAENQNKNVLVYLHAAWCGSCREFEKFILPCPSVVDSLKNFLFVPTSLDSDELGIQLARKYGITTAPVYLLISPSGQLLHYHTGIGGDSTSFFRILTEFKTKGQISGYSENFSIAYPAFYTDFFPSFKNTTPASEISSWLSSQKDLENEVCFNILSNLPVNNKYLSYFFSHCRSYAKKYGVCYYQKLGHMYLRSIDSIILHKDTLQYGRLEDALYVTDSLRGYNYEWLKRYRYIQFLGRSGLNWDRYIRQIAFWQEKYGNAYIRGFADDVYNKCFDKKTCNKMAQYLEGTFSDGKDLNTDLYFKYAVLLRRGGQQEAALRALKRAIELSPDNQSKATVQQQWNSL